MIISPRKSAQFIKLQMPLASMRLMVRGFASSQAMTPMEMHLIQTRPNPLSLA